MENKALWINGPGQEPHIGPAPTYEPGSGQMLIRTKAAAVQPGEWKVHMGVVPVSLTYPTINGFSFSGIVEKVGPGVTRFKPGDRVATNGVAAMRDDYRMGAYQRFALTTQELSTKIGDMDFEVAAALSTCYPPASALFLHLGLQRPSFPEPSLEKKEQKVLIWGASSSFGAFAVELATDAGYSVVGVGSRRNESLVMSMGATHFIDRMSSTAVTDLIALGPFDYVVTTADSAEDQERIAAVMAAHGGGDFLATMGLKQGAVLPKGVTVSFHQFVDDYLDPKNKEFTEWFWWGYLEDALAQRKLKGLPLLHKGGLSQVKSAWDALREEKLSGQRQVIRTDLD